MEKNLVYVGEDVLYAFAEEVFQSAGLSDGDAAFHARALVDADLWGVHSHGCIRIPPYYGRMRSGAINTKPNIRKIRGAGALEVLDGDAGSGLSVGRAGMERAIELARSHHVGVVGAVNSNHFGAGGTYARLATAAGMAGIAMTGVKPIMGAVGASGAVVGNNPLAIAVPTYGDFDFCLDFAMSKVALGKLQVALKSNQKIPLDWATDETGRPTDDPGKALKGLLLPMGEHKGLGLAIAIDILTGVICGGAFADQIKSMYAEAADPSLTCHLFLAIDLDAIIGRDELKQRMAAYHGRLKKIPMWREGEELYLPGEIEYRTVQKHRRTGIPIPIKSYEELLALKEQNHIAAELLRRA